jgi:hypothetical protein
MATSVRIRVKVPSAALFTYKMLQELFYSHSKCDKAALFILFEGVSTWKYKNWPSIQLYLPFKRNYQLLSLFDRIEQIKLCLEQS